MESMNRPRPVGFTVLEMLVTLLLVGLVLTLSVQLLVQVQVTSLKWRRTLPDPVPQFAIQLLRNDIHRSRATAGLAGSGPLALTLSDGSLIAYESAFGELVRVVIGDDGTPAGRRTVMRGVDLWRWRLIAPGLVEVSLVYRRHPEPSSRIRGGVGALEDSGALTETLTLRFAQRARPGRRVW
jgi:hypothetical protein